jgi:hypothetical protein
LLAGERRHELRQIEVLVALGRGKVREAEVGQPGLVGTIDHHVARPQGPMGDPGPVQPVHLGPQSPKKLVAYPPGLQPLERAAVHPFGDQ